MDDIELVVKIPKELKEALDNAKKENAFNYMRVYNDTIYNAFKNGKPLPKGHGKIIDATFALEAKITKDNIGVSERTKGWNEACQAIYENASTIIEADKEK